ncbi:MAG: lysophospholipid acyltransferase family protein [Planctomycetota bacterium]|jgi:1-acyl-sn-glycerol-3-phosphate acyltransferase
MKKSLLIASRIAGMLLRPMVREVSGIANFPREGPAVLIANHLSVLDGLLLAQVMNSRVGRHAHFISYKYLFQQPFLGFFLRFNQGILLDNDSPEGREKVLEDSRRLLRAGKVVALFPEAHTCPVEEMRRAQPGGALLALETGAPVVPIGLIGTQKVMPREGDLPGVRWKAITVRIGKPLDVSRYREPFERSERRQRLDIVLGVSTIIMRAVAELSGQEYRHGASSLRRLERLSVGGAG